MYRHGAEGCRCPGHSEKLSVAGWGYEMRVSEGVARGETGMVDRRQ